MLFYRLWRSFAMALLASIFVACAAPLDPSSPQSKGSVDCGVSTELIVDPFFATIEEPDSQWQYSQHSGPQSFTIAAEEGTITFERVGPEPWAILRQIISDDRLDGATIRYTADLRGDVSPDVNHFFGAKAGLFLQIGKHPDAFMGDQDPSNGQWDWQTYSVVQTLPVGENSVSVGFIHQAGEGAIEARNPSLVLVDCLE